MGGDLSVAFDQKKWRKIPSSGRSATTFSRPIVLFGGEGVTVPTSPIALSGAIRTFKARPCMSQMCHVWISGNRGGGLNPVASSHGGLEFNP